MSLQIDAGERVSIIGRNGTGKSTLLQIISGELPPDAGSVWRQPALRIARLVQDVPLTAARSVFDVVSEGLTDPRDQRADGAVSFTRRRTDWNRGSAPTRSI